MSTLPRLMRLGYVVGFLSLLVIGLAVPGSSRGQVFAHMRLDRPSSWAIVQYNAARVDAGALCCCWPVVRVASRVSGAASAVVSVVSVAAFRDWEADSLVCEAALEVSRVVSAAVLGVALRQLRRRLRSPGGRFWRWFRRRPGRLPRRNRRRPGRFWGWFRRRSRRLPRRNRRRSGRLRRQGPRRLQRRQRSLRSPNLDCQGIWRKSQSFPTPHLTTCLSDGTIHTNPVVVPPSLGKQQHEPGQTDPILEAPITLARRSTLR